MGNSISVSIGVIEDVAVDSLCVSAVSRSPSNRSEV